MSEQGTEDCFRAFTVDENPLVKRLKKMKKRLSVLISSQEVQKGIQKITVWFNYHKDQSYDLVEANHLH